MRKPYYYIVCVGQPSQWIPTHTLEEALLVRDEQLVDRTPVCDILIRHFGTIEAMS